jgi:RNA polymerase sigma-70 factor (ECF subfamily)
MLRNQADAEDLTQEVFLRVFLKANTFRGESRFSTWLHRLTFNLVLMELRKQRRRPLSTFSWGGSLSEEDHAGAQEIEKTFQAASAPILERVSLDLVIAQLSSGYRKIFILHDAQGYGHEEIARLLGISEGTSKSQLHKARRRLRALLQNDRDKSPCGNAASLLRRGGKRSRDLGISIQLAAA